MKTRLMTLALMSALGAGWLMPAFAQIEDDIYYNPKKEKTQKVVKTKPAEVAEPTEDLNYDQDEYDDYLLDVDAYNRYGYYPATAADTIGTGALQSNDYKYTQYIQKFENPTIILDNADALSDVLDYSDGTINIVVNNTYPSYSSWYSSAWWPYSSYSRWYWNNTWYNNWYSGWYTPWYAWLGWDLWYPSYSWSWGGGYYPGWSYYNKHWASNHWRPNGNNHVGGGYGWANQSRPGYKGNGGHRDTSGKLTGTGNSINTRPGSAGNLNTSTNNHRVTNSAVNNNRVTVTDRNNNRVTGTNNNRVTNSDRVTNSNRVTNNNRVTNTNNNRVTNTNNNRVTNNNNSYTPSHRSSSPSYNGGGSRVGGSGGSFGGGSRGGGGGGGSRGGGGHR